MNLNEIESLTVENVELYSEPGRFNPAGEKKYYLRISYLVETKSKVERITYPKVALPIFSDRVPGIKEDWSTTFRDNGPLNTRTFLIDVGFGETELLNGGTPPHLVQRETIKEKIQDFTMEELEKLVGGKIRIVKEKPNGNS